MFQPNASSPGPPENPLLQPMCPDCSQTQPGSHSIETRIGPPHGWVVEEQILLQPAGFLFSPLPLGMQLFPLQFFALYPLCLSGTAGRALPLQPLLYLSSKQLVE